MDDTDPFCLLWNTGGSCGGLSEPLGLLLSTEKPFGTGFRGIEIAAAAAWNRSRNVGAGTLQDRRRGELVSGVGVRLSM